jgi:anion-transporting  ArsA/GET3 family ATPase
MSRVPPKLAAAIGLSLALTACSRDEEVNRVVADFDGFSKEIVSKVKTAPNLAVGLLEAQKLLDANKEVMVQKLSSIKDVKGFQVSADTKKKMEETLKSDAEAVGGLGMAYVAQLAMNAGLTSKFQKLADDYRGIVTRGLGQ